MAKKVTKKSASKKAPRAKVVGPPDDRAVLDLPTPKPLASVIGQDRAVARLAEAMASGRLHHAWIFHGPEGVGKFTTALAWAATLLDPTTAKDGSGRYAPDPDSPTQALLGSGTHPDLHVIVKELARFSSEASVRNSKLTTIAKDVVDTHLIRPASLAAVMRTGSMAGKVFIVDEAELMDRHASNATTQNAILKTLEEPAPGTVIILVTSSEDRLLPTIRSRCQRIAFAPLPDEAMRVWLARADLGVTGEERDWFLRAADGSPGRLLAMHESGVYQWHRAITPHLDEAERGVHPVELGAIMGSLIDDWAKEWVKQGDPRGENRSKDAANRLGARRMLALVGDRARAGLADPRRRAWSLGAVEAVGQAQRYLDSSVNMKLVFEHLAAAISARPAGVLTRSG
ncbi:MAG: AAA family ATPase [Phycisphaerales bacterium]|nr:AAA family ATPase [Planctomycetota bacterium]MCH8509093.1 AAA family ATPase [Phycisphaerales bacterium]